MKYPIYLDNHSTTPVDPKVLEAMMPYLREEYGNPASSTHSLGWNAAEAVTAARKQVAEFLEVKPEEIVFTAGTTEANNAALKGVWESYKKNGNHIITQVTEHKSVLEACKYLESLGAEVTYLGVDENGSIRLDELKKAVKKETILISIMHANNETGTIQPIREIAKLTKTHKILFHVDAAQTAGKYNIPVKDWGIDLFSFSAHKMYGPKGAGALFIRSANPHVRIKPLIHGGGQENGMRSGTLNVPAIVGLGKACEIARQSGYKEGEHVGALRDQLQEGLMKIDQAFVNGHPTERLFNNLNISFAFAESEALIMAINDRLCVSSGSACASGMPEVSYVLKALNLPGDRAETSLRFGLGRFTIAEEISEAIQIVTEEVDKLRRLSPLYQAEGPA